MEPTPEVVKASRTKLVIIILVAFVPILVAYLSYFYLPDLAPSGTTNRGDLIVPPLSGEAIDPSLVNYDGWVMLQPLEGTCDAECEQMLYLSRQVITGLGRDASRISRVLLLSDDTPEDLTALLAADHPDVAVIKVDAASLDPLSGQRPVLFIMDPNANIMMRYTLDKAGKPMLKDLKHLLRVSNIG